VAGSIETIFFGKFDCTGSASLSSLDSSAEFGGDIRFLLS